ncbi:MAG: tetratricopeptide repeat protein [Rhodobacteraceae bacterium]|nr:tetratricopeptide repeat protein [Paracoccaceae bacterium]
MARAQMKASPQAIAALKAQLAAANQANEAKRPDIALEKADRLLATHPRLAQAHLVRATALMSFRKVDLALAALSEAAKCAPQDEAIWTRYVTDLHRAGQKGRARRVAEKAPLKGLAKKRLKALAKGGPNLATTSLGDVPPERVHEVRRAIEAGRLDDARDLLDPLIADWPEVAFLHNMRGIIHMESGSNGAAEQALRRALTLSPGFAEAQANLGAALSRTGQIREAVEVLSAAFSANPLDYAAKYNLADALYQAGRLNEARILGEEMRDQSPDNNDVLTHLARVYGGMGEHQRVVETIQKVWASRPVDMG